MSVGKLNEFNLSTGTWSTYIERLQQYFKANNIAKELEVPTLIACVGDATYELMVDLCAPKKPSEEKFADLVTIVSKHVQPEPSVLAERYKFRKRHQVHGESISQYAASLKHLARTCKFNANLAENLRDQFVCGLYCESTRQRLFSEGAALTYANAYAIAVSLEMAANDAAAVEQTSKEVLAVHAVHASALSAGAGRRGGALRRRGTNRSGQGGGTEWNGRVSAGACFCCGGSDHTKVNCKFKGYTCRICLRVGHLKRVCPNIRRRENYTQVLRLEEEGDERADEDFDVNNYEEKCDGGSGCGEGPSGLYMVQMSGSTPVLADVEVAGRHLRMHVDTGSPISCVSQDMYRDLFSDRALVTDKVYRLKGYDGQPIKCLGYIVVPVKSEDRSYKLRLYVIYNGGVPLLGREWLKELRMNIIVVNSLTQYNGVSNNSAGFNETAIIEKYRGVFGGQLGCLRGRRATIRVRAGAVPVYRRARALPLALRSKVDAELLRMERAGVISPVSSSDWASCLVIVLKSNGALRICGDYKSTVNPVLEVDRYPLPQAEVLFSNLSGGKRFSKIDLSEAYSQIQLDESKKYTVVNTHRGLFVYNRLVYGLASAPSIFQRIMEQLTAGIPNVSTFLDDILITGDTEEGHMKNLHAVLTRLANAGLTVRQEKCTFFEKEVSYLGFIISEQGVKTDPKKVDAVLNAPKPTNVTELRSFLGLVNFYSKFIKDFSFILAPLYRLLKIDVAWGWTSEDQEAFERIKVSLTTSPVLIHYNENLPLILCCDASARGVGAVLSHGTPRGERPVAYASRTLSAAEAHYSQIQREALSIVFGVKKFHSYVYGRKFTLRTDHQPLVSIFGCKKDLPQTASGRLIRWAVLLSGYQYDIEYVRSKANSADALSRLPVSAVSHQDDDVFIKFIENNFPISSEEIRLESKKDKVISKIMAYVQFGWPVSGGARVADTDAEMAALWRRRDELCVEGGCLLWGCRVVVPETLRARVLRDLHATHMGIVKSKGLARGFVWWPNMDAQIEVTCASCEACAMVAESPPRSKVIPWPVPSTPFERVHIDFFHFHSTYLVMVDGHSKWIEVVLMVNTTAMNTISKLREIFARFGIPKKIVSDNGPPFTSKEFLSFLSKNGIKHVTSTPYHPSSNGEAENAVRIVKRALKRADADNQPLDAFLQTFLLNYRNSIHSTTQESPARMVQGHNIRSRLDLIKDGLVDTVTERLRSRADRLAGKDRCWEDGALVWTKNFGNERKWVKGKIRRRIGINVYEVETEDGNWKSRHADQLRSRMESNSIGEATATEQTAATPVSRDAALAGAAAPAPRRYPVRERRPVTRYGIDYILNV